MLYKEETLQRGKKLINKIWNVSKFIEMHLTDYKDKEFNDFEYIDKWIINKYINMEKNYINYLENYEVGKHFTTEMLIKWKKKNQQIIPKAPRD